MNRNATSRGRWLVAFGAIIIIGACLLQWWQIGGGVGELPRRSDVGISDGPVFLGMFLGAVALLLLITLPYASEKPVAIDHPLAYLLLLIVVLVGFVWRVVTLFQDGLIPLPPLRGPGFWIAIVGIAALARGVFEVFEDRRGY
jgi:hypothetical protein